MTTHQDLAPGEFAPGEIVCARGREWIVIESSGFLRLRPLLGSESGLETILPELEIVSEAHFQPPKKSDKVGGRDAAQLLRDSLRLTLRRGAGPFRGAGHINFEPKSYQLAPLMMALRQDVIRLLIADGVGVGKTIEAGLILRELVDRNEIDRFTVLSPPHLVEQWVHELESKFSFSVTPVTSSNAASIERNLTYSASLFEAHPFTVVSMDFIKNKSRLREFIRSCPGTVVVDEAHVAVSYGRGRHMRFDLVRSLADDSSRNLLLLTATPHSGNEPAFYSLLGLLDKSFEDLFEVTGERYRQLRERLASHFIQRRRRDIDEWEESGLFPKHQVSELKYRLTGEYEEFHESILDYCAKFLESADTASGRHTAFWGKLALMCCACSSASAALSTLESRFDISATNSLEENLSKLIRDDIEISEADFEPAISIHQVEEVNSLIKMARKLSMNVDDDPKFKALTRALSNLIEMGHSPIVFCRYVATADQVGIGLSNVFRDHEIQVINGKIAPEDRERAVESLGSYEKRILVTTDCLSEGINLQNWFDAIIHYDLSWNPTRHQQREGRVDRFGQRSPVTRSILIYGENNPVDGAVLKVILRKAEAIVRQTGVRVPMPDKDGSLTKALMSAVILNASQRSQPSLDLEFDDYEEAKKIDVAWKSAADLEKGSRTIFAHNSLRRGKIIKEWEVTKRALGGYDDTKRFVFQAMKRLGHPLLELGDGCYGAATHLVPDYIKERFLAEGIVDEEDSTPLKISFSSSPPKGSISVHRAHALPAVLAEMFFEQALEGESDSNELYSLPRTGAWEAKCVDVITWLFLLRIRHRIDSKGKLGPKFSMAEESAAVAFSGHDFSPMLKNESAFSLLSQDSTDLDNNVKKEQIERAIGNIDSLQGKLDSFANERSAVLAEDHIRVREALGSSGKVTVEAITPVDIVGVYVLVPSI